MHVLLAPRGSSHRLEDLYAFPRRRWVRANFVSTLDGAGTGADGRTDSINTPADNRIFALQRRLADAVLVGAGTARAESYTRLVGPPSGPGGALVVISGSGRVPAGLRTPREGRGPGVLVTSAAAEPRTLASARRQLGADNVWVCGDESVDLALALDRLTALGLGRVLCEGGPSLLSAMLATALVDELSLTVVPAIVGGDATRITHGPWLAVSARPRVLLEEAGTVLGLWRVSR